MPAVIPRDLARHVAMIGIASISMADDGLPRPRRVGGYSPARRG
jgi:hypothetical protein